MRFTIPALATLAALTCAGCLRTTYNHCTEMPPDRECELLDAGTDGGPPPDASASDAGTDAEANDAGTDATMIDAGSDAG
jgi:hypothetical protein